jgi:hypothetical protein
LGNFRNGLGPRGVGRSWSIGKCWRWLLKLFLRRQNTLAFAILPWLLVFYAVIYLGHMFRIFGVIPRTAGVGYVKIGE